MTLLVVLAFVGLPFLVLGLVLLLVGVFLGYSRHTKAGRTVSILKMGEAAEGRITEVTEILAVRVNGRHPWMIAYRYQLGGREYHGSVNSLSIPGLGHAPGRRVWVFFLPAAPELSALYPHP